MQKKVHIPPGKLLEFFTVDEIKQRLSYDPNSGLFTHLLGWRKGRVAGCLDNGYVKMSLYKNGICAQTHAHRLAWLFVYGTLPVNEIDHINGDRSDNRIKNLRDVTRQVNAQNLRKPIPGSRTGVLGVSMRRGRYTSSISIGDRVIFLGDFETKDAAQAAYIEAKRRLHAGCTI